MENTGTCDFPSLKKVSQVSELGERRAASVARTVLEWIRPADWIGSYSSCGSVSETTALCIQNVCAQARRTRNAGLYAAAVLIEAVLLKP